MRRREFIKLISGAAAVWPLAARSQQPQRRVGVLLPGAADDPEMEVRLAAFPDELQQLGWTNGRNVRIDTRWDAGSNHAEELVAQAPDVILASTSASVAALRWITRSVPIGHRSRWCRVCRESGAASGNITGFSAFEYSLSGK